MVTKFTIKINGGADPVKRKKNRVIKKEIFMYLQATTPEAALRNIRPLLAEGDHLVINTGDLMAHYKVHFAGDIINLGDGVLALDDKYYDLRKNPKLRRTATQGLGQIIKL